MSQPVVSRRVRGEHPFDTDELIAAPNREGATYAIRARSAGGSVVSNPVYFTVVPGPSDTCG